MNQSEQINELATALALAQAEIRPAVKDTENTFFKSSYADLAEVWRVAREPLSKNGLAVVQVPTITEKGLVLETTLVHKSGQWMRSVYPIEPVKRDPQGVGSAITYARRYALAAMVGVVAADEDDDGEQASGRETETPKRETKPQPQGKPTAAEKPASGAKASNGNGKAQKDEIEELKGKIAGAETFDALKEIGEKIAKKPKAVADAVREDYKARKAAIQNGAVEATV